MVINKLHSPGIALTVALWLVFAASCAQQNLFNIPSGDITPKRRFFYQQQVNIYSVREFESKSHVVYGAGRGWDVGINLVDVPLRLDRSTVSFNDVKRDAPLYPFLMATLQKQLTVNEKLVVNVGTQVGPNVTRRLRRMALAQFTYAIVRWHPLRRTAVVAGPYFTNGVYTGGEAHTAGWMFGYEVEVTERISLMGDVVSGRHKKSVSTFGGVYTVSKRVQLCLAALLPFPDRTSDGGVVLELNAFGWDFREKEG